MWLLLSQNRGPFAPAGEGVGPDDTGTPDHAEAVGRRIGPDDTGTPDHARSPDYAGTPHHAVAPDNRRVRNHRNRARGCIVDRGWGKGLLGGQVRTVEGREDIQIP